jgi:hypothetical protein
MGIHIHSVENFSAKWVRIDARSDVTFKCSTRANLPSHWNVRD